MTEKNPASHVEPHGCDPYRVFNDILMKKAIPGSTSLVFHNVTLVHIKTGRSFVYGGDFHDSWLFWRTHTYSPAGGAVKYGKNETNIRLKITSSGSNPHDFMLTQHKHCNFFAGNYRLKAVVEANRPRTIETAISSSHMNPECKDGCVQLTLKKGRHEYSTQIHLEDDVTSGVFSFMIGGGDNTSTGVSLRSCIKANEYELNIPAGDLRTILESLIDILITNKLSTDVSFSINDTLQNARLSLTIVQVSLEKLQSIWNNEYSQTQQILNDNCQGLFFMPEKNGVRISFICPKKPRLLEYVKPANDPVARIVICVPVSGREKSRTMKFQEQIVDKVRILDCNHQFEMLLGMTRDEVLSGTKHIDYFFPEFQSRCLPVLRNILAHNSKDHQTIETFVRYGSSSVIEKILGNVHFSVYTNEAAYSQCVISILDSNLDLELRKGFDLGNDSVFITNKKGVVLTCSGNTQLLLGYEPEWLILHRVNLTKLIPGFAGRLNEFLESGSETYSVTIDYSSRETGKKSVFQITLKPGRKNSEHIFVNIHDITSEEIEKEFLKNHDSLTKLQNDYALKKSLGQLLLSYTENESSGALVIIHVDNLRGINSKYGTSLGEALLKEIAVELNTVMKILNGTAFRGNHEAQFAVILDNVKDINALYAKVNVLLGNLPKVFLLDEDKDISLTYTLGVMGFSSGDEITDPGQVIRKVEYALNKAKERVHTDSIEYYRSKAYEKYLGRIECINSINDGIRNNRFETWYQPLGRVGAAIPQKTLAEACKKNKLSMADILDASDIFTLQDGYFVQKSDIYNPGLYLEEKRVTGAINEKAFDILTGLMHTHPFIISIEGMEALLRYHDTAGNLVTPDEFITIAEETSQIIQIESKQFAKTLMDAMEWQQYHPSVGVSINFSAKSINAEGFVDLISGTLQSIGYPPEKLAIEFVERDELNETTIDEKKRYKIIADLGVRLYCDDFGEGTNSVHRISMLHDILHTLKISITFSRTLCSDKVMENAVKSLVYIGKTFGKKVMLEGVETREILSKIVLMGVLSVQGYGLSKPMPKTKAIGFLDWFKNRKGKERYRFPLNYQ